MNDGAAWNNPAQAANQFEMVKLLIDRKADVMGMMDYAAVTPLNSIATTACALKDQNFDLLKKL